ncbi:homoserine O-acetyltransferase MetX [Candidatus Electronema sp. TJ]|uniref:homoserine O-acetyltransferase MetX n=1 Tax=Candidatus Electronema sp. TJ TaxID=3401573 RepID=UPI003AA7D57E
MSGARQHFTFAEPPGLMPVECGAGLGPITLAYETWGELSPQKDNVILVLHAFSGDSHVASHESGCGKAQEPGWWEFMVGPGKGIDTRKYFVLCSNIIGGCMGSTGPSSISPETGQPYGMDFPVVTVRDMVRAQKMLLDHLGIRRVLAVIGGSMGGMQALQWCASYPETVASAVLLATTARHSALSIAFNEIARQAIMADPKWRQGSYYGGEGPELGLAVARMIGHVTYLSDEAMRRKFGRRLQDRCSLSYDFNVNFQVESYLHYQGEKFVRRFDANSLLYITKAADYFDFTTVDSGTLTRMADAGTRFLVVSFSSDWLYPTYQSKELVRLLKKNSINVSFCEIEADSGHDGFLIPSRRLTDLVAGFLRARSEEERRQAE